MPADLAGFEVFIRKGQRTRVDSNRRPGTPQLRFDRFNVEISPEAADLVGGVEKVAFVIDPAAGLIGIYRDLENGYKSRRNRSGSNFLANCRAFVDYREVDVPTGWFDVRTYDHDGHVVAAGVPTERPAQ